MELSRSGVDVGKENELRKLIENNPEDWVEFRIWSFLLKFKQSRYDLGVIYRSLGKNEEAVEQMFSIVKGNREWNDSAARSFLEKVLKKYINAISLVQVFDSLDEEDEFVIKGRRRLRNLWFL